MERILKLNEIQSSMLARILKEEIVQQRQWKEDEKNEFHLNKFSPKLEMRDYLSAQMWDLIEQLCAQDEQEYWLPNCMKRTDEEEDQLVNVKHEEI